MNYRIFLTDILANEINIKICLLVKNSIAIIKKKTKQEGYFLCCKFKKIRKIGPKFNLNMVKTSY